MFIRRASLIRRRRATELAIPGREQATRYQGDAYDDLIRGYIEGNTRSRTGNSYRDQTVYCGNDARRGAGRERRYRRARRNDDSKLETTQGPGLNDLGPGKVRV